jgi:methionyl aminopeptidase
MIYSESDVAILRASGQKLAQVLQTVAALVKPGVSTADLEAAAARGIKEAGGEPSFLGYKGSFAKSPFPGVLCTSINDEVVHAPSLPGRILQAGDNISLDIGMRYPAKTGLCTDMAITMGVGEVSLEAKRLIAITKEAMEIGIAAARPGVTVGEIGRAIQNHVESAGFSIVRDLVGHGVGKNVHEPPEVPNFYIPGPLGNFKLEVGQVIAIEPMVTAGDHSVETLADDWTVRSLDRSLAAHFENTLVVTATGPEILTKL